ncbi:hypothetical protein HOLleu_17653 [Holothuria leucospilota]|uniref:exodeoxyribonuclease III n=1 Tax=Holothuria leucospilota TaxID=206669 RepID=A0A9Q1C1L6_HOLLE|nr:hypothetical protein HOLleu_17653 [Holothuria leucospilota]
MVSVTNLKLCSVNVRGLRDRHERRKVFLWLRQKKCDIYFLQETHSVEATEHIWNNEWGNKILFCHGQSNSMGVCILFKRNISIEICNCFSDNIGRSIIANVTITDYNLTLVNIYAPSTDDINFYHSLRDNIENHGFEPFVIGGDFNTVLNVDLDKRGSPLQPHPKCRNEIYSLMKDFDLKDIWRELSHNNFRCTWKSNSDPIIYYCRLDYFLISFSLVNTVKSCEILAGVISDHNPITLSFESCFSGRGPGYWKLNVSLLNNADYVQAIKDVVSHSLDEYTD